MRIVTGAALWAMAGLWTVVAAATRTTAVGAATAIGLGGTVARNDRQPAGGGELAQHHQEREHYVE